ncbi:ABC transporter substrate-binding protein [Natrarchaeobaculum sulfurireducens]|nr:ABC transporter substrate-binding protein [Natrarchaeobaculum sulfurireducens]
MNGSVPDGGRDRLDTSRRAMLAAGGVGLTVATSGCVRQVRSAVNRDEIEQLSVTITTVPADGDRESIQLSRAIRSALEDVGIAVDIDMQAEEECRRTILVNHDFDLYVGRHPGDVDPDFLYESLHSRYADEAGWQNPFGFANTVVDDLLESQRDAGDDERETAIAETLEAVTAEQPFVSICVPEEYRLVRTDRFGGWEDGHLATRHGYLGLEAADDEAVIRAVHTDARVSKNLNPLSAEYREQGTIASLVYDSLATIDADGEVSPWLAADWTIDDGTVDLELREECSFHDGEAVTAADVAFTYELLADTTLGRREFSAPTPLYRGHVSAVEDVSYDDEDGRHLELRIEASEAVAERALLAPILPAHVWTERAAAATVPGVQIAEGTTEALVTDDVPPVGSGPYRFDDRSERDYVAFERFEDHFTLRDAVDLPEPAAGVRFQIDPRSTSAIELIESDDADVTSLPLESYVVDDVLEETGDDVDVHQSESWSFYHLGFNARRAPFSNPNFRRAVAQVLDKAWLVETVFDGHARPVAAPVSDEWLPEELEWDGADPVTPFLGTNGEVDFAAARDAFEEAGYRYADDGTLRVRR